jgi:hypothetical protein
MKTDQSPPKTNTGQVLKYQSTSSVIILKKIYAINMEYSKQQPKEGKGYLYGTLQMTGT